MYIIPNHWWTWLYGILKCFFSLTNFQTYKYIIINKNSVLANPSPLLNFQSPPLSYFPHPSMYPLARLHPHLLYSMALQPLFCTFLRRHPSSDATSHCFLSLDAFWAYFWVHQHICKNIIIYNINMIKTQVLSKYR